MESLGGRGGWVRCLGGVWWMGKSGLWGMFGG